MNYYFKSVIPVIESNYNKFTTVEKSIADFFINNLFPDLHRNVDIVDIENLFISMRRIL